MTDQRPPRCEYDRTTGQRLTRTHHLDDCRGIGCTGCLPCTAEHCVLCQARHVNDAHPLVCPRCVGGIREDLDAILVDTRKLRAQAIAGSSAAGRLLAAAPIPGADAMVMLGPSGDRHLAAARYDLAAKGLTFHGPRDLWAHYTDDHRPKDLEPPLSLLASWEDTWRSHLQAPSRKPADVADAVAYFDRHLTLMAQLHDGPDIVAFARDVAGLRARLEEVLHDEHTLNGAGKSGGDAERGIECFECGVRLVRRIQDPKRCSCGPRPVRRHAQHGPCTCPAQLRLEVDEKGNVVPVQARTVDPDDGHIHPRRDLSCIACHLEAEWEARHAKHRQGGVDDPAPGLSWECPGCRKKYTAGEYATAVRRDLSTAHEDEDGRQIGWTTVPIAAEAAAEQTGRPITAATLRTWAARAVERETNCEHPTKARRWLEVVESYPELGDPWSAETAAAARPCSACTDAGIGTVCQWEPGRRFGVQLVFWPDVADRISEVRKGGRPSARRKVAS